MSKNAIAFLAGLGTGYMNETKSQEKQKRDDEDRALRNEAAQLQIDASKKAVSDQRTLAQAGAPIAMTEGVGGMLKPDTMDNRDVGLPENADLPNQGLQQGAYSVGGKSFAERGLAEAELAAQNTPEARSKRVISAMSGIDPIKALDAEQTQIQRGRETVKFTQEQETYAKKLRDEGAIDVLKALRSGDAAGMVAAANKGGEYSIVGQPVLSTEQREIPGVGSIPTFTASFQMKGKDGKTQDMKVNSHDMGMSLMPYEKWYDTQLKGAKEAREGRESNSKINLQNSQAGYYNSSAAAKESTAPKSGYERMSEFDKSTLTSINKQRETINTAITKAQAEGSWDDASPGSKALKAKLATLVLQESQLHARYGDGGGAQPDPLGMRAGGGAASPTKIAPATQAARDGERIEILNQELSAARQRLARGDPHAQGDIDALQREIGTTSKKMPTPNAASAGLPVAAAPKATPVAAAQPAAPVQQRPNLANALGVKGNSAIDQVVAQRQPAVEAAASAIQGAKTMLAAVAKSGDPQALNLYAGQLQQAKSKFDALLKDMTPQQAEAVRQAAGYYL